MKTLMALVLSFGMVLLGTAPVMAAGEGINGAAASQQLKSKGVQITLPDTKIISDDELEETSGEVAPEVIGGIVGAIVGGVAGYRDAGWKGAIVGASVGALAGVTGGAVGPVSGALIAEAGKELVYDPIIHGK